MQIHIFVKSFLHTTVYVVHSLDNIRYDQRYILVIVFYNPAPPKKKIKIKTHNHSFVISFSVGKGFFITQTNFNLGC